MKSAHSTSLARDLDALYRVGVVVGLDDRELLGRFTSGPGAAAERAFEIDRPPARADGAGGLPPGRTR